MLKDPGLPDEVLDLGKARLKFAEITTGAFGYEEWVLHGLWPCDANSIFDRWGDLDERIGVATKAAEAAGQLISLSIKHTSFYDTCHLHDGTISVSSYCQDAGAYDKVTHWQVVTSFRDASTNMLVWICEDDTGHTVASMSKNYSSEDMKMVMIKYY